MRLHLSPSANDPVAHDDESAGLRLLLVALAACLLYHGGLLPFTHRNTYDAYIHMFFGDHYRRSWFDPWEPRWYTGFSTTTYPPGTHMAIGALAHLIPLRAAFVAVMMAGLLTLTIGVYRFALIYVAPRAAGCAAIGLVMASSISETVHLFGQLPTIFSLGLFLNGLPHVYRWIVLGRWRDFGAALTFAAATTAAHHVTTIFGSVLFIMPLALYCLKAISELRPMQGATIWRKVARFAPAVGRGIVLGAFMLAGIVLTVFAYWYGSITDPITQVPIPHGTRESFIARPDLGFIFFVLPWGTAFFVMPYAAYLTLTTRLWPLGGSLFLCVLLGTGGTTPIPKMLLGGAFDILTLDRFTFWGSILILPFTGHLVAGLLHGRSGRLLADALGKGALRILIGFGFAGTVAVSLLAAVLPVIQPTQPERIDPVPIVNFLSQDEHDRWRYLTLGFGDQFAYISALTDALSIDGNYHSARRLPDMTRFSVERLENAKYLGVPGLGSLQQFLVNAEQYNLKYVFSNDEFYDPLLHFSGWTRLNRLPNGVAVWEKPDIPTLPLMLPRRETPVVQAVMWGLLPPGALVGGYLLLIALGLRRNFGADVRDYRPVLDRQADYGNPVVVRRIAMSMLAVTLAAGIGFTVMSARHFLAPLTAEETIRAYFDDLDFRRFDAAYALLDPASRPPLDDVMFAWRWKGGLIASYGKLAGVTVAPERQSAAIADWSVRLDWMTAIHQEAQTLTVRTVLRDGRWYVAPVGLRPEQTPVRLQRQDAVEWNVVGRRQPKPETDLHRDRSDRPTIALSPARLVRHEGRYAVVGEVSNVSVEPAHLSLFGTLVAGKGQGASDLARQAGGTDAAHRLLGGETAGYRVDFEGVLSLTHALARREFDPTLFIPPELAATPDAAKVEARGLVTEDGLYRGVALNGVSVHLTEDGGLRLAGTAVNAGVQTATLTRVTATLFDADGRVRWVQSSYVPTNIYPGQSAPFSLVAPSAASVEVIADIGVDGMVVNGLSPQDTRTVRPGLVPLRGKGGYSALRLSLSTYTYDPLF